TVVDASHVPVEVVVLNALDQRVPSENAGAGPAGDGRGSTVVLPLLPDVVARLTRRTVGRLLGRFVCWLVTGTCRRIVRYIRVIRRIDVGRLIHIHACIRRVSSDDNRTVVVEQVAVQQVQDEEDQDGR